MQPTLLDYVGYFFQGYKIDTMNPAIMSLLRGLHYVVIGALATIAVSMAENVAKGQNIWDLATWQTALTAAAVYILGAANEYLRKQANPSVSITALPAPVPAHSAVPLDAGEEEHPSLREIPPEK